MNESLSSDQIFIAKLTEIVLDNLTDEGFSVERLAQEAGMSRVNLYRRLKSIKNQDINKFIREIRLQKAMEMLQNKLGTAAEISYRVGFGSPAYFNKCFHEYFGYPPGKVKLTGSFKKKGKPLISKNWRIASYISFVLIVALIGLNIIPRSIRSNNEKSIAVLPFKYMGDDPDEQHLADAVMEEILHNLKAIEELRVLDRTSVEQYRDTEKTASEICKKLGVRYLLEGSLIKIGDRAVLHVNLVESGKKKDHPWSKKYDEKWQDIFEVQSEVAQMVAEELRAVITPEEKQLIEKPDTANFTAYDFYLRGVEESRKYSLGDDRGPMKRAESFYHKALEYDSTFAKAYVGLAWANYVKQWWYPNTFFSENFMDSVLILADIALSYDDQLAEAYTMRGRYYYRTGFLEKAEKEYNKAIRYNPNDVLAYSGKALLYKYNDPIKTIENLQKADSLGGGLQSPDKLSRNLSKAYLDAGFPEKAKYYLLEALKLDGNSSKYNIELGRTEFSLGNYEKVIEFGEKLYPTDSSYILFGECKMFLGQNEESLEYFKLYIEKREAIGGIIWWENHYFGYAYCLNGFKKEAEYYFNIQINYCNSMIELGRIASTQEFKTYYVLAQVFAFRGEKDKAYENLKIFSQRRFIPYGLVVEIKNHPLFNSIRDEPEFQQIVHEIEAKHQAEHERVRKWLEENEML